MSVPRPSDPPIAIDWACWSRSFSNEVVGHRHKATVAGTLPGYAAERATGS
jgi:hypothetical protein